MREALLLSLATPPIDLLTGAWKPKRSWSLDPALVRTGKRLAIALVAVKGLNFGVDFVGGQSVRVEFSQTMPAIDEIREKVGDIGLGEATIQQFGSDKAVSIRTALPEGDKAAAERAGKQLVDGIHKAFPTAKTGSGETV
ncbi:MAG: hypothetical protein IBJ13_11630, partial [Sphingopyxis sp.]|nr:hypothetical protein [Sphingopyxis sp.]